MNNDRRFHRNDFTGGEGPGLKKLRAARAKASPEAALVNWPKTRKGGLEAVREFMRAGLWESAILEAAKFGELGEARDAILKGREGIMRPDFQRQLKRDPEALIEAAKAALIARYGQC